MFNSEASVLPAAADASHRRILMSQRVLSWPSPSAIHLKLLNAANRAPLHINSPIHAHRLHELLQHYQPADPAYTRRVLRDGILHGHYIRYEGERTRALHRRNHPAARAQPDALADLLVSEIECGRLVGPFDPSHLPTQLQHIRVSPLNLVPKGDDNYRLIFDLSYPHERSINDGIMYMPTPWQKLSYALQLIINMGQHCHLLKMDVKSAYRTIPVHHTNWPLLACTIDGMIFVDTCMPFGLRSSGNIFERYGQAIQYILQHVYRIPPTARWVDDFLFVLSPHDSQQQYATATRAFNTLGVPIAADKTEGPCTCLAYLGYSINTTTMQLGTTPKARDKLRPLLHQILDKRKRSISLAELGTLIGKLDHLKQAVRAGRSRVYCLRQQWLKLYRSFLSRSRARSRQHSYYTQLTRASRVELQWWLDAINVDTQCSIHLHVPWPITCTYMEPYSDACTEYGAGAYWQGEHLSFPWSPDVLAAATEHHDGISVPLLEAIGVAVAVNTWRHTFANQRVLFRSDATAVVGLLNRGRASTTASPWFNAIATFINDICCEYSIDLRALHVPGANNELSDALSRNQLQRFCSLAAQESYPLKSANVLPITILNCQTRSSITCPHAYVRPHLPTMQYHGKVG